MRHFIHLPETVTPLACGVGVTATKSGLMAPSGFALGAGARRTRTAASTVALAAVAVAADEYRCAAAGAAVASSRRFYRR
ncbi:MAG: hypothetical protein ACYCTY_12910 [Sulfuricella sp.]